MTDSTHSETQRADWLGVLAQASPADLTATTHSVLADYRFEWLRQPEQGLIMVRARIGNTGDRFNLGEATITRCAVRHQPAAGGTVAGVGHVLGRDAERAERVAQVDALLQVESLHVLLMRTVIDPLRAATLDRGREERSRTEASRVRFFTLQPEVS